MQAHELYEQGILFFRNANLGDALTCFRQADAISPHGRAEEAKKMIENILNFRHTDLMNP